jgi:hypothetical protein
MKWSRELKTKLLPSKKSKSFVFYWNDQTESQTVNGIEIDRSFMTLS